MLALSILCWLPAPSAQAALLVYEPFAYADGFLDGVAATGLNLTGPWAAIGGLPQQDPEVLAPGLGYGSLTGPLPPVSGGRLNDAAGVTAAGATVQVDADVLVNPGDTIFWSALFTFDDSQGSNFLANITFHDDLTGDELFFGEPVVGLGGIRVAATTTATGGLVANGADNAFVDGATMLLIGRYENSAAADGDLLQLLVYDTGDAEPLPATFDPLDPNADGFFELSNLDIDFTRISSITFTIRGTDDNFIDELRIGDDFASVVTPEPGAGLLVGLGLVGLAARGWVRKGRAPALA